MHAIQSQRSLGLDRKLGRYLMRRRGIFIEAGASHAFTQSNPYYLQRFLG